MKDYEKHVVNESAPEEFGEKVSYCGALIKWSEFYFQGVEHVMATIQSGGRLLPCPKCKKAIIDILKNK